MKTVDTNLCIGGPYNGQRIQLQPGRHNFDVFQRGGPDVRYIRSEVAGEQTRFAFWQPSTDARTVDAVLLALFRMASS